MVHTPGVSREHRLLVLVVVVALAVRLWAVGFALPHYVHPDEPLIVERAKRIVDQVELNPHWFNYPVLYLYVETVVIGATRAIATRVAATMPTDPQMLTILYTAGRCTTAVAGTASVVVAHLAARRLWGPTAGLAAATVLALSFGHVQQSQYIKPDVPAALFVALCLWLAAGGVTGGGRRWLVASGIAAGLAAATKYNAGLCLLLPLTAWAVARDRDADLDLGAPVLIAVAAALAFVMAMPWVVLDPHAVLRDVRQEMVHYRHGQFGAEGDDNWRYYLRYLWSEGLTPPLALLALFGWILLALREPRRWLMLSSFPLAYYALLAGVRVRFARNLMPVMPLLAVVAGYGAAALIALLVARRVRPLATATAVGLVLVWPAARIAVYDHFMVRPDTFRHAAAWLAANEPAGTTICSEIFPRDLWDPRFTIVEVGALSAHPLTFYPERGCDLVVAVSYMYRPALRDPALYPEMAAFYHEVFERWPLVAEFHYTDSTLATALAGEEFEVYDPVIRVHRVPAAGTN